MTARRCQCPCHLEAACIADDLEAELTSQDAVLALRIREAGRDIAGSADWHAIAGGPTYAELVQRRRGDAA